jgi:hypothetical protein
MDPKEENKTTKLSKRAKRPSHVHFFSDSLLCTIGSLNFSQCPQTKGQAHQNTQYTPCQHIAHVVGGSDHPTQGD